MGELFIALCMAGILAGAAVIIRGFGAGRRLTRADRAEDAARKMLCLRRGWRFRREAGGSGLDVGPLAVSVRLPDLAWRVTGRTTGGREWDAVFRHERDPDASGNPPGLVYACPSAGRPHEVCLAHADEIARMQTTLGGVASALTTLAQFPDGTERAASLQRLLRDGVQRPAAGWPDYVWVARRPELLDALASDTAFAATLAAAVATLDGVYVLERQNAQAFWLAWQRDGLVAEVRAPLVPAPVLGSVLDALNGLADRAT